MKKTFASVAASVALTLVAAGCVGPPADGPPAEPEMLAVAYSNLDGVDGYDPTGSDVLIARLMDTNGDGVHSAGDTAVLVQYPLGLTAPEFGEFGSTTHVGASDPVIVGNAAGVKTAEGSIFVWRADQGLEAFLQLDPSTSGVRSTVVQIEAQVEPPPFEPYFTDTVFVNGAAISDPATDVGPLWAASYADDPFIDVDIFI